MDKIICVGKNYLKHALELGDPIPEQPIIFLKPPSVRFCVTDSSGPLELPRQHETHHEVELVLKIGKKCDQWHFTHFTYGLDLTLRELQSQLKKSGLPWEKAKVFRNSAVIGPWHKLDNLAQLLNGEFSLSVNSQIRQKDVASNMRWKPLELLEGLQTWLPLCEGDVLFTGTPEGVGPLKAGDRLEVHSGTIRYKLNCI